MILRYQADSGCRVPKREPVTVKGIGGGRARCPPRHPNLPPLVPPPKGKEAVGLGKLTIRVSERVWEGARDPELLVGQLSEYLRRHTMWIWRQPVRYRAEDGTWQTGVERPVMLSMEKDALLKLVLRPCAGTEADYLLVALRKAREVEVYEAATGRSLKGTQFQILRPWEFVTDVVVVIHPTYLQLPQYLKAPITLAWDRLVEGKEQAKVALGRDTLFVIRGVVDQRLVTALDNFLLDAGAGRTMTDRFETRRAVELIEKCGQECGH